MRVEMEKPEKLPEGEPSSYEPSSPFLPLAPTDQVLPDVPLGVESGEKEVGVRFPSDTTSLEESAWRAFRKELEQKERYRWLSLG